LLKTGAYLVWSSLPLKNCHITCLRAVKVTEFIDRYGTQFEHSNDEFEIAWAKFLTTDATNTQNEDNGLSRLIRGAS